MALEDAVLSRVPTDAMLRLLKILLLIVYIPFSVTEHLPFGVFREEWAGIRSIEPKGKKT